MPRGFKVSRLSIVHVFQCIDIGTCLREKWSIMIFRIAHLDAFDESLVV